MASVNPLSRELVFKIVYYGPGLGGKTTTLEHIHATAKPEHRGKLVSLATPVDRTLYFDFLPVRLPPIRGMHVRLQLFTVPGQVYFNATRKLVLTGADGVVFVSDSQLVRADANLESLENLRENLADQGRDLTALPVVFQHNKRDLPDLLPVSELDSMLNPFNAPSLATSAKTGMGVYEALEKISERVLESFKDRLPELYEGEAEPSFEPAEGGLVMALRDASTREAPPSDVLVARIGAPGAHPSIPPESIVPGPLSNPPAAPPAQASPSPPAAPPPDPSSTFKPSPSAPPPTSASPALTSPEPPKPEPTQEPPFTAAALPAKVVARPPAYAPDPNVLPAPPQFAMARASPLPEPPAPIRLELEPESVAPARQPPAPSTDAPSPSPKLLRDDRPAGVSFAVLWPEGEQDMVRDVEDAISRGRYWRAIELCETLVSRVLASAAGLFGTSEAPRDAATVPILLGIDGRRYLTFRSIVREARGDGLITAREALAVYAFAIDCRIARSSIH
jgi:signal recognition particle receptor subunit beta